MKEVSPMAWRINNIIGRNSLEKGIVFMRKKIRILLLVLIVSVFANTVNFPIVNAENLAEENELQLTEGEKTNFNFIKTSDLSDIVYTY